MGNVTIRIDGRDIEAPAGSTILEAASSIGITIPTLCYLKEINEIGACRVCVVEVEGARSFLPACVTRVTDGMVVLTKSPAIVEARRTTLELICSNHDMSCGECVRGSDCELRNLCKEYGVDDRRFGEGTRQAMTDDSSVHLVRDNQKCVLCRRCVNTCRNVQGVSAIFANKKGYVSNVGFGLRLVDTACVSCGQCVAACPTGALSVRHDTEAVWRYLADKTKHVVAVVSPYVGAVLGESFAEPMGVNAGGKTAAVLRRLGFDCVFETGFMPRGEKREKGELVFSGSCPAWVRYCETFYPEFSMKLSALRSPGQIMARLCREHYARTAGIDPKNMVVVSVSTCTAEKYECRRPDSTGNVDTAITAVELAAMFRRACVSSFTALRVWRELSDEAFDVFPYPEGHNDADCIVDDDGRMISVQGLGKAKALLEEVKSGRADFGYAEIMACPGGCLNGGGAAPTSGPTRNSTDVAAERAKALRCGWNAPGRSWQNTRR